MMEALELKALVELGLDGGGRELRQRPCKAELLGSMWWLGVTGGSLSAKRNREAEETTEMSRGNNCATSQKHEGDPFLKFQHLVLGRLVVHALPFLITHSLVFILVHFYGTVSPITFLPIRILLSLLCWFLFLHLTSKCGVPWTPL